MRAHTSLNSLILIMSQVFSHFLAPYVENLDMGLVNLGIVQGESMSPLGMFTP